MASSTDVLLNPVGGLVLGCVASASTVTILKYFQTLYILESLPDSTFRIAFGFLSGIFVSIIVASRNSLTPTLADSLLIKGGYEIAAIAVTLGLGIVFGVSSGFIIKYLPGPTKDDINNDRLLWEIK